MNTGSGGSAANGRPRRKAALKADKNRKDADAATAAAAKAAESSDDDAAAAEESDDDEPAPTESASKGKKGKPSASKKKAAADDEPAPKAGSKRKAVGSGGGGKRGRFARKAEAEAKYPPQEESRKRVEPSSETLDHLEAAGSEFVGGHGEFLNKLISKNDLTVIHLTWDDLASAEEVDDAMKLFWKVCFNDTNIGRSALTTGGPRQNWKVKQLLDEPRFSIIKQRLEEVAEACKCKIDQVFAMFYCEVEKRRRTSQNFDGGADFHGDFFPEARSNSRFVDTFGTPKEGKKTMSFKEMKTGKVVTISVPHGTVILMSSLAAGNDFGEYQHAVEGAWGTGFLSVDMTRIGY